MSPAQPEVVYDGDPAPFPSPASARERDVFRYLEPWRQAGESSQLFQTVSVGIDAASDSSNAGAVCGSDDTALAAFAQLGTLRMNTQRSMIALFGPQHEYLLAESTRTLSLQSDETHDTHDALWVGTANYANEHGLAKHVLGEWDQRSHREPHSQPDHYYTDGKSAHWFVVSDLRQHPEALPQFLPNFNHHIRFMAAVPLTTPKGVVVGAYMVLDSIPRYGISERELVFMEDMAKTAVNHLASKRAMLQKDRAERLLKGLAVFSQGGHSLRHWWLEHLDMQHDRSRAQEQGNSPTEAAREQKADEELGEDYTISDRTLGGVASISNATANTTNLSGASTPSRGHAYKARNSESQFSHPSTLSVSDKKTSKEKGFNLRHATEAVFARAANLIREAMDLDGVLFLDAGFAQLDILRRTGSTLSTRSTVSTTSTLGGFSADNSDLSEHEDRVNGWMRRKVLAGERTKHRASSSPASDPTCSPLGFSTKAGSSVRGFKHPQKFLQMSQTRMKRFLRRYPEGNVFYLATDGTLQTSSESENPVEQVKETVKLNSAPGKKTANEASILADICDGARCIAFIPLWDPHRENWRSGALVWTDSLGKIQSREDLSYLSSFVNCVTADLIKLDTLASEQAKATFMSCISHELRSPLHGVLAGSETLLETDLTRSQREMAVTVQLAGSTLLDTINTILDFSRINTLVGNQKSPAQAIAEGERDSHGSTPTTDLGLLTENAVNTLIAGQRFQSNAREFEYLHSGSVGTVFERDDVQIILDISQRSSWHINIASEAWKRILTNLVGNALKFTVTGYVHVAMEYDDGNVVLTVQDTGSGISEEYRRHHLYVAFRQGSPHTPGMGLGLFNVKQVVDEHGGSIDIDSHCGESSGTTVVVRLPVRAEDELPRKGLQELDEVLMTARKHDRPLEVRLVMKSGDAPNERVISTRDQLITTSVQHTCEEWLGASFELTPDFNNSPDIDLWLFLESDFFHYWRDKHWNTEQDLPRLLVLTEQLRPSETRLDLETNHGLDCFFDGPFGPRRLGRAIAAALQPRDEAAKTRWKDGAKRASVISMSGSLSSPRQTSTPKMPRLEAISTEPRKKLLLVEDNNLNMRILIAWAKKLNQPFVQASNGLQAVQAYTASPSSFGLVLMDISMPIMDGFTATREMRNYERQHRLPRCGIVALTGVASDDAREEASAVGIDVFMTKPASYKQIHELIKAL
ncbi:hypothetical protein K461DRAFT_268183 [Myriangium duriaei CBS 260.36]|uniref:histidine kinase n=1 Tax=Myriangium duriaei CBS 260.36 TaxID=1168546 RepID=A0A9P4J2T1_9PEZI|nr:hypothetical protein K461DRAFT_268183 [Myriangium duriaei CBS 260.36]